MACTTYATCNGSVTVTFGDAHVGRVKVIRGQRGVRSMRSGQTGTRSLAHLVPAQELQKQLVELMHAFSKNATELNRLASELGRHRG